MLTLFATENQIELREVEYFVSKTKLHKSTGEDNITYEIFKKSLFVERVSMLSRDLSLLSRLHSAPCCSYGRKKCMGRNH